MEIYATENNLAGLIEYWISCCSVMNAYAFLGSEKDQKKTIKKLVKKWNERKGCSDEQKQNRDVCRESKWNDW